ncbi:MAG: hypothetical protein H3C63_06235 [Candidatus Omnitrophica bacterium]|nr:hypothetical protein [bacterium]MBW7938412.1 hypothetical protein [Candidatus Omnitrophota bacterium]
MRINKPGLMPREISRRTAVKNLALGVASAAILPTIISRGAQGSDMKNNILGSGNHQYEWIRDWGKLPAGIQYGYTHGVCVDSQGRIFIHNQSKDAVIVFDGDGTFIKSWGADFAAGAHGLQLSKEGNEEFLYLADIARRIVVKTTLEGEVVWTIEYPKEAGVYAQPEKYVPTNVAIAPNGDFYVADGYGSNYIHQYNSKAEYVRTWGGEGTEAGKMRCPHGIAVDIRDGEPKVLVADRANVRLQYFNLEGKHLFDVNHDLRHPCHFDQRNGDLLIPDLHGRVTIFDKNNNLITHLGDNPDVQNRQGYPNLPQDQRIPGLFISPHSACWDHEGNIYVVEWVSDGRVSKLRRIS